jgi:hypothetical protein
MSSLSTRKTINPCHTADHVESGSGGDLLEVRFFLSNVTGTPQTHHPNTLGNGALNPSTPGVHLGKVLGLLPAFASVSARDRKLGDNISRIDDMLIR